MLGLPVRQHQASMKIAQVPMRPGEEDFEPPYSGNPVPLLCGQPRITFGEGGIIKSKDYIFITDG
jgi:hypothetical protein